MPLPCSVPQRRTLARVRQCAVLRPQGRQVAHVGNELKTLSSDDAKGSLDDFFRSLGLPHKAH